MSQAAVTTRPEHFLSAIVIGGDEIRIPAWVKDLKSFRQWVYSPEFPEQGRIDYLNGEIWVDLSMEEFFTHNQVKGAISIVVGSLVNTDDLGRFILDRMRITHILAGLSCEPDAAFACWETWRSGLLRLIEGATEESGIIELEGTPDMILEILSASSQRKDEEVLRELYWRAGIPEYWLVDVRKEPLRFEILKHTRRGYISTRKQGGWLKSAVFGKSFQLTKELDPLGKPKFVLLVR